MPLRTPVLVPIQWPWRRSIQQAAPVSTPAPPTHDLLGVMSQVVSGTQMPVINPDPLTIELAFLHSHELASADRIIRELTWRQGLRIVSTYGAKCDTCGKQVDSPNQPCPEPGCPGTFRAPDEEGKRRLEALLDSANSDQESLLDVAEDITSDGVKHGRFILVFRHQYLLGPDGAIMASELKEIRRASPGHIRIVRDPRTSVKGGVHYVCLHCRGRGGYRAETRRQPCTTCGGVTYDAWYVQTSGYQNSTITGYYLPNEVHEAPFYYRDGTAPVIRVWHKAWFFIFADYLARLGMDPRGDKRPDKMAVFMGVSHDSVRKWLTEETKRLQKNPYGASTMVLPASDLGTGQKQDAKILDFGDDILKGQAIDLRQRFQEDMRAEFGLSGLDTSDTSQSGGLNQEGLQLRRTAQTIERQQNTIHLRWLNRAARLAGVRDWQYSFDSPFEEDDTLAADLVQKHLLNASTASSLGLQVRWEDGRAIIPDGIVDAMDDAGMLGLDLGLDEDAGQPGVNLPDAPLMQASPTTAGDAPKGFTSGLGGPSGSAVAEDAVFTEYAGVPPDVGRRIRDAVVAEMRTDGWTVTRLIDRIRPLLEEAGVGDAGGRARVIARTETAVIISEWKRRVFQQQEAARPGRSFLYRLSGVRDHRRTKLSTWVEQQVGRGLPLVEVERLLDEGIDLAKQGAFMPGGALFRVVGRPLRLPAGFQRRGFVAHFGDRDNVVRTS